MAPATPSPFPDTFNIAEYFLDRPAQEHPRRTAIAGVGRPFTYVEVAELANRAGNALRAAGIDRGDRVLIVLPDSAEFIAAFFGTAKIGAVAVPVNSMARATDYAHYLNDCGARIAIVHSSILGEFLPASGETPQTQIVIVGEEHSDTGGVRCLRWSEWTGGAPSKLTGAATSPYDTAFILYTSGSGGQPKGAVHRHKDMLAASRGFGRGVLGLRPDDVTFSVSKLFFAYGLGNGMYFPFSVGAATLLNPERTKVETVAEIVTRHKPTVFFSVPTFYAALLREAESGRQMDFSSVRIAVSAGEALPAEIFERFRARFGLEILDGIGSTEMLQMFLSSRPGQARPGSCGFPVPGYEARIVDDAGEPVKTGDIGNLWVKGESAFACYWQKEELTARTKRAGDWIVTGDKFTCDADGYYHYCGRVDDMMKVAGMWVSPGEVENALLSHPQVAEGAVVGVTTQEGLTDAVAYVTLRGGARESPELAQEIREHVKARLVAYKCPREVRFCADLPKTATGKIQRFKLREGLMGELHPQMKVILEMLAKQGEGVPKLHEVTPELGRYGMEATFTQFWNADAPPVAKMADREIDGPRGPIPIRLYDPGAAEPPPCLIYFHGGGFVIGSIASHDGICRRLANYSGLRVISVGYRLAPEHKFPQPLEDCAASVRWIAANAASLGIDPARLFVGGDSAGANLALVTAMVLRDEGGPALKGAALLYGTYVGDLETSSVKAFGGGGYFLTTKDMIWFSKHYLNSRDDGKNPKANPIHADLAGLPPLYVAAAEFDPLLDDSKQLAERLRAIGAPHKWVIWPGVTHACLHMTRMLAPADGFLRDIAAWMKLQSAKPAESKMAGTS